MSKPRCSAEFQEHLCQGQILVGSNGFTDGPLTKDGKRTYYPIPVMESPANCPGAVPANQVFMDILGRKWGGNGKAARLAKKMTESAIHYQPEAPDDNLAVGFLDEW